VNAANYIVDSIKKSAVFADGKIVFKNDFLISSLNNSANNTYPK
jgi:hypothetical protein